MAERQWPEHDKQKTVLEESHAIGEFLETSGYVLAQYREIKGSADKELVEVTRPTQQVLADHFDIDLDQIHKEKEAMLAQLQAIQAEPEAQPQLPPHQDWPEPFSAMDDDGYPHEVALERIREIDTLALSSRAPSAQSNHAVLAHSMACMNQQLGSAKVSPDTSTSTNGAGQNLVTIVTGGWSGNEDVVAAFAQTIVWRRCWESSHAGGMHVLRMELPAAHGLNVI